MPLLVMFHSDDFRWSGPPHLLAEWDILVAAFEATRYKVKDCTKEPFFGINVTSDTQVNYYLDQKDKIKGIVKAARVTGAKVRKLPYPLDGPSLSNADNAKDAAEAAECASPNRHAQLYHGTHKAGYSVRTQRTIPVLQQSRTTSQRVLTMFSKLLRVF